MADAPSQHSIRSETCGKRGREGGGAVRFGYRGSGRWAVRTSSGFSPSLALEDVLDLEILQISASGCRRQESDLHRWQAVFLLSSGR